MEMLNDGVVYSYAPTAYLYIARRFRQNGKQRNIALAASFRGTVPQAERRIIRVEILHGHVPVSKKIERRS